MYRVRMQRGTAIEGETMQRTYDVYTHKDAGGRDQTQSLSDCCFIRYRFDLTDGSGTRKGAHTSTRDGFKLCQRVPPHLGSMFQLSANLNFFRVSCKINSV